MPVEQKRYPGRTVIWVLLVIGFMIMEFPGVYFFNRIDPMILGLPFIYSFTIIMWAIMCLILLVAYLTNWGRGRGFVEGEQPSSNRK